MARISIEGGNWSVISSHLNSMFSEIYAALAQMSAGTGGISIVSTNFRILERDGKLCVDQILNSTGFAGDESTDGGVTGDWMNLQKFVKP
jgi:hypothetical protein